MSKSNVLLRSAYDGLNEEFSAKAAVHFDPKVRPSLTHQSFKDECDINVIVAKFAAGYQVKHVAKYEGQYGDFATIDDYQNALNTVMDADEAFSSLDAKLRERFDNDPAQFLDFVHSATQEELRKAGLLNSDVVVPPPSSNDAV